MFMLTITQIVAGRFCGAVIDPAGDTTEITIIDDDG